MTLSKTKIAVCMALATVVAGCGDNNGNTTQKAADAAYFVFATDSEGHINVQTHNVDNTITEIDVLQPLNSAGGTISVREPHFAHGKVFIPIGAGVTDAEGAVTGGGLAILDMGTLHLEQVLALPTTKTFDAMGAATISRFVHTYMDPDGKHLWLNNDGVTNPVDQATNPTNNTVKDSVFRVNIDPDDNDASDGDVYLEFQEIVVGHGHKKSTFSIPSTTHSTSAQLLMASHNLQEESISIIDNDPTSLTFLDVLETIDMKTTIPFSNTPHGMDFSEISGKIYTGITKGADIGLAIVDAINGRTLSTIQAGMDMTANQIPGGGYVHVSHDQRWVMTAGYVDETGYLSIIDAQNSDAVVDVINLGNLSSSSIDIAESHEMVDGVEVHNIRVFIPSRKSTASVNEMQDTIAVVDIDAETGIQKSGTSVKYIPVKTGTAHRNGTLSPDHHFVYYPSGGDCGTAPEVPGPGCHEISIIDVHDAELVATMHTEGHEPNSISIIEAGAISHTPSDTGGHAH